MIRADKFLNIAPLELGSSTGLKQGDPALVAGYEGSEESHGRLFITRLTPGGPGEKSQLQAGDIILKVNRQPVRGQADFYRKVWAPGSAGVKVPISILRETEIKDIRLNSIDRYQLFEPKAE